LVEGTRIKAAQTQIESALDISAKSALANYNYLLKELYGLMALSSDDPDLLMGEIIYYLERNLMVEGIKEHKTKAESTLDTINESETVKNIKKFLGVDKKKEEKSLDLYDYKIENVKVQPIYNLSEPEVLRAQILEYMKYRGPKELSEGLMDKFLALKDFKKQADILKEKLDVDKNLTEIKENEVKASDNMVTVNKFATDANIPNQLDLAAQYILQKVKLEKAIKDMEKEIEDKEEKLEEIEEEIDGYKNEIKDLKKQIEEKKKEAEDDESGEVDVSNEENRIKEIESLIKDLEDSKDEIEEEIDELKEKIKANKKELEDKKTLIKNVNDRLIGYIDKTIKAVEEARNALETVMKKSVETVAKIDQINEKLEGETNEFSNSTRLDLGSKKERISAEDLTPKIAELNHNLALLNDIKNCIENARMKELGLSDFGDAIPDIDEVRARLNIETVKAKIAEYKGKVNGDPIDYYADKGIISDKPKEGEKDPRDSISDFTKKGGPEDENPVKENKKTMPEDVPSKNGYKRTELEEIKNDMEHVKNILGIIASGGKSGGTSTGKELGAVDLSKTSFSKDNTEFSKSGLDFLSGISEIFMDGIYNLRDEIYINEYIMGSFANYTTDLEKDLDLRGNLMKNRPVFFDANHADVEYILGGFESEKENINAVKAQITLVRFALNVIAIYTDPYKFNTALEVATVVAGWTGGVGVPIVHTLIMMAWAMAESLFDVYLLLKGESIPIFKTRNTWITDIKGLSTTITNEIIYEAKNKAKNAAELVIDYTENKAEEFLEKAGIAISDYIDSKIDLLVDKAFASIENPFKEGKYSAENIFNDLEASLNVKVEGEVGDIMSEISSKIQTLLLEQMKSVENSTIGDYVPVTIQGIDYTDFLEVYKNKNLKEAIAELTAMLAEGKELFGYSVEETSKKVNSMIFNTIQEAKKKVKNNIKAGIENYRENLVNKFKETFQKVAEKGKEEVNKFIDSIGNTNDSEVMKTNLKGSFLSMKYADYLRLFLLFTEKEVKMRRIADLIQVNMRTISRDKTFKMSECSTYMRIESSVSIKYLFATKPFIPKEFRTEDGKRIKFDVILYKGY